MSVVEILESMSYGPAPENRGPGLEWIAKHGDRFEHFINGQWQPPVLGDYFETINPATGSPLASIAQGEEGDVESAVMAARAALPKWRTLPGHARARYLYALARQVQRHSRLLAVLESLDNGKPIRESRDIDIPLVARHFYHHAGWAQLLESQFPGYGPVGVVGQIIPWNFPLLMLAWKIAPALAAGNTVVLKPAEFTPLTALAFAEIVQRAQLPPGTINIVTGDGHTGEQLVCHPGVDKIAFTGSTEVGRSIRRATAGSGKDLSLELGGKSPFLVFEDADLDSVIEGVVDAIWFNQGQVCCAGSRLLVQESIEDRLLAGLRERMEKLRIGDPLDKAVDIGAIIAPVQLEKIERLVRAGVEEGASIWQPAWACPTDGYFYPPTLLTNVSPAAQVAQVEIFGPVLVSMTFRSPTEAVALANNTRYGLAASVWTEDINLAFDVARQIKAGTVWINSTNLFDAASGFGGYRESGYGREGGREGLYDYLCRPAPGEDTASMGPAAEPSILDMYAEGRNGRVPAIDTTPKLLCGGKQTRPDSGYTHLIMGPGGEVAGEVGEGNRKDVRNAVEAAHAARGWSSGSGHARAQILFYLAENLSRRSAEFAQRIHSMTGAGRRPAEQEVGSAISRLFTYAAWADKFDGHVHNTVQGVVTLAVHEPLGVMGIACPDVLPLLGFLSLVAPAIAMGNSVVAVPSERYPLSATDLYQVLDTSDVPAGVVNIVTGNRNALATVLAEHDDVDGIWYFGDAGGRTMVERASAENMKRTWTHLDGDVAWLQSSVGEGEEFLRQCTQVKNIWVPYGV